MNRKKNFILFLLLLLYSCNNGNDILDKRIVNIIVKYEDQSGVHIDYNANIYIYYGVYSTDISEFTLLDNGILVFKNQTIIPTIAKTNNNQEKIMLLLDVTKKVTIIVESGYFQGQVGIVSYSASEIYIKSTFIFKE